MTLLPAHRLPANSMISFFTRIPTFFIGVTLVISLFLSLSAFANSDTLNDAAALNDLFGLEVFVTDPARQEELKAEQEKKRFENLPKHIHPDTLQEDEMLDMVDLEKPVEPAYETLESEVSLTSVDSNECCLRAIRSSRYEVEAECRNKGFEIWGIISVPITFKEIEPIRHHRLCAVYHNDAAIKAAEEAAKEGKEPPPPDYYLCRARSQVKCFNPTGENAIFATPSK